MEKSKKIAAAVQIIQAMSETIRQLKRVQSGYLYAQVMQYLTIEKYNEIIGILKSANLIAEKNHELIWIGAK
jgi:hypothetical protein